MKYSISHMHHYIVFNGLCSCTVWTGMLLVTNPHKHDYNLNDSHFLWFNINLHTFDRKIGDKELMMVVLTKQSFLNVPRIVQFLWLWTN